MPETMEWMEVGTNNESKKVNRPVTYYCSGCNIYCTLLKSKKKPGCSECGNERRYLRGRERKHVLENMGFQSYDEYLKSDLWKFIRGRVFRRDGELCRGCRQPATQGHHRRYGYRELMGFDITHIESLCAACHNTAGINDDCPTTQKRKRNTLRRTNIKLDFIKLSNARVATAIVNRVRELLADLPDLADSVCEQLNMEFRGISRDGVCDISQFEVVRPALKEFVIPRGKFKGRRPSELLDSQLQGCWAGFKASSIGGDIASILLEELNRRKTGANA